MPGSKISALSTASTNLLSSLYKVLKENNMNRDSKLYNQSQEYSSNKSQITWVISKDTLHKVNQGKIISSPTIKLSSSASCVLEIYPSLICKKFCNGMMILSIRFRNLPKDKFLDCDISLIGKGDQMYFTRTFSNDTNELREIRFDPFSGVFEARSCLVNGNLKILCNIKYISRSTKCVSDKSTYQVRATPEINYSGLLLESAEYSDVIFEIESLKIICHKCIIASESPALSVLLKTLNRHIIEMPDRKFKVVKDLITFMYSENINFVNFNDICALYIAADEFGVLKLKDVCTVFLSCCLTEANVAYLLELSQFYRDQFLIETCLKFIKIHDIKVLKENFMTKCMPEKC